MNAEIPASVMTAASGIFHFCGIFRLPKRNQEYNGFGYSSIMR